MIIPPFWQYIQWCSTGGFIVATIIMISPLVAATAITPWIIYFIANGIWLVDSAIRKNIPYVVLSVFFCGWDILLVLSRLYNKDITTLLQPFITIIERIP